MRESPAARLRGALERSDVDAVARALARRARLHHDAGDPSGGLVVGRTAVAATLVRVRELHLGSQVAAAEVNGSAGAIIRTRDAVVAVLAIAASPRRIRTIWMTTSPEKLVRWQHRAG